MRGQTADGPAEYFVKTPYTEGETVAISAALVPGEHDEIRYRANGEFAMHGHFTPYWHWVERVLPARYCPVDCCVYHAQILRVRAQRVQEITEVEAHREGWYFDNVPCGKTYDPVTMDCARTWYQDLWNSLHKKQGERFEDNPWVWTYDLAQVQA